MTQVDALELRHTCSHHANTTVLYHRQNTLEFKAFPDLSSRGSTSDRSDLLRAMTQVDALELRHTYSHHANTTVLYHRQNTLEFKAFPDLSSRGSTSDRSDLLRAMTQVDALELRHTYSHHANTTVLYHRQNTLEFKAFPDLSSRGSTSDRSDLLRAMTQVDALELRHTCSHHANTTVLYHRQNTGIQSALPPFSLQTPAASLNKWRTGHP